MHLLEWIQRKIGLLIFFFTFVHSLSYDVFQKHIVNNSTITNKEYHVLTQYPLPGADQLTQQEKQDFIKGAFVFSWEGYRTFSWGYDENRPVSNRPINTRNGWGATIVDALDTLFLMELDSQFEEARNYVKYIEWKQLKPEHEEVQVFETVIRYVGGLLSAYDLSNDDLFITKAVELVHLLLPAFDTPTGIPYQYVNFRTGIPVKSGFPEGASCLAELGSVQLEFTRLSQITGNWTYHYTGQRVYKTFQSLHSSMPGLFPHLINPDNGKPVGDYVSWGGMSDSFYEYLIKQYIMSNQQDMEMKEMAITAVRSLEKYLVTSPQNHKDKFFLATVINGIQVPVMDELACFAPGALLLASRAISELNDIEILATKLMEGCYTVWNSTKTGLAPETFGWKDAYDGHTVVGRLTDRCKELADTYGAFPTTSSYILRPETLESLYYFYKITGDDKYERMAWDIFNSLHMFCRTSSGFSGIRDVDTMYAVWDDRQESFFFAETFKYLYLFYDTKASESVSFRQWVFNTEAHPFRISNRAPPKIVEDRKTWYNTSFKLLKMFFSLLYSFISPFFRW
ncbi:glycoside hydrolase [Spinellus fusiger]|nr:glycoside hydrolase [Spinellus fusiger]